MKRGADLNVKDGNETTPLHHLVKNKFDVLAMWFVHCGADIHAKDRKMFSPLDYALPSTQHDLRVAAGEISGLSPASPLRQHHPSHGHCAHFFSAPQRDLETRATERTQPSRSCTARRAWPQRRRRRP